MQLLTFCQTTDIVETRIKGKSASLIALHAASWLSLSLQHQHLLSLACQQRTAYQSAKPTAYNHYIVSHIYSLFTFSPAIGK